MKAELIAVGTEILLGEITDTNTPFIARELANLGIDVYFQATVGDNPERLKTTIEIASKRSDLIILSGGLGPTEDDLTKQTVAKALHRKLITDSESMTKIARYFAETKRTMTENNRVQAMYIDGAIPIKNRTGFAVGIFVTQVNGPDFLLLPGPPSELEPMVTEQVLPLLKNTYFSDHILQSRVLRFFGIGESQLTTQLADLIQHQKNPTIAPYAKQNEVTLRLTAWVQTEKEAQSQLADLDNQIQVRVGQYFYGYGEHNSLSHVVADKLRANKITISTSEGFTGGLLAASFANEDSDGKLLMGGQVVPVKNSSNSEAAIISRNDTVRAVQKIKHQLKSDFSIAIAQPSIDVTGTGEHVGSVWMAVIDQENVVTTEKINFSTIRPFVKERMVLNGLSLINKVLK
ncbi:competence/damage-inducible protein A [Pediococcus cellicola]|uniref:Putative competence-damage inducible protein n=1 Tax=Pediococcus cellicola TaxID=319652 RepID=A0A0R2IJE4_9LACO|nr:competence/damage-inducible protein A [Pediococcus cellicola]KRN65129.1 competence damage-inducible protein A [Pediococcus cellicola]GEL15824.1 putative competence-damage inducible protein [Pediococcus cellicola]